MVSEQDSARMKENLESIYDTFNRKRYIHPDPIEYILRYSTVHDREIAALIASAFAFGRVSQILSALSHVFMIMGHSPRLYIEKGNEDKFSRDFKGFVYRFVRGPDLVELFMGILDILSHYQSLENCFVSGMSQDDETVVVAIKRFVHHLVDRHNPGYLVANPDKGSAMKRMNLFLRWMVRKDNVDPGGWDRVNAGKLVVPLDTHMHKISRKLGLTVRKQADMKTAEEITRAFKILCPDDPVKYDFSLTRFGIRPELDWKACDSLIGSNKE